MNAFLLIAILSTQTLVLRDGRRVEVKHYEVRDRMVVLTTPDGHLRSIPVTWVDVQATPGWPENARRQHARTLLSDYGVRNGVSRLSVEIDAELRSIRSLVSHELYDALRSSYRNAFAGDRVFDDVVHAFAAEIDDETLATWSRWMTQPDTRRLLAMEAADPTDADDTEKLRYLAAIYQPPVARERIALIARIDRAVHASDTGLAVVVSVSDSLQNGARLALEDPPALKTAEELRVRLRQSVRRATRDSLLYSYRSATDEELEHYLAFWESDAGRRIAASTARALAAAAERAAHRAVTKIRTLELMPSHSSEENPDSPGR